MTTERWQSLDGLKKGDLIVITFEGVVDWFRVTDKAWTKADEEIEIFGAIVDVISGFTVSSPRSVIEGPPNLLVRQIVGLTPTAPSDSEPTISQRGFAHFDKIPSAYGGHVKAYESSAATAPHVWVSVTCPEDLNELDGPTKEAVAHLHINDAIKLRDQLTWLIEHHYQLDSDRGSDDEAHL
jgi:hypothetical protein